MSVEDKYTDDDKCGEMSTMKGTKVLASEYVVGQKKPKVKAKTIKIQPKNVTSSNKQQKVVLKLDHLLEDDDDDDDDKCDED